MTHLESVLIWRQVVLGVDWIAWWIVMSSPVLFDWAMFLPTGVEMFLGLLLPNQMPRPADAFVSLLRVHEPLVNTMLSCGGLVIWGHQAGVGDFLLGFVKMRRWVWISLEDVTLGLKILTYSGWLIA